MNQHHQPDGFLPEDPDQRIGLVFRRLSSIRAEFGEGHAFDRAVRAVLGALGRAVHEEAERRACDLREREEPARFPVRVTSTARRLGDFDGWDPGDPE